MKQLQIGLDTVMHLLDDCGVEWDRFDEEDRAYIKANYADDYQKYFAELDRP